MATVWVYAELTGGEVSKPALEILTKARDLGDSVAAVVLGSGAKAAAGPLGEHGAQTVYAGDEEVFDAHLAQPRVEALHQLITEHNPNLLLFATTYDSRDVAGRLQARTASTLMGNATDVLAADRAQTQIFGGSKIVDVELKGPDPKLVLVRPKSFVAEPSGGSAEVVEVKADIGEDL